MKVPTSSVASPALSVASSAPVVTAPVTVVTAPVHSVASSAPVVTAPVPVVTASIPTVTAPAHSVASFAPVLTASVPVDTAPAPPPVASPDPRSVLPVASPPSCSTVVRSVTRGQATTKKPAAQLLLPNPKRPKTKSTFTVSQALDRLESSSDWAAADIYLCPPGGDNSDGDSEDETGTNLDKLKSNMLLTEAVLKIYNSNLDVEEDVDQLDSEVNELDVDDQPSTSASVHVSAVKDVKKGAKGKGKKKIKVPKKNLREWKEGDLQNNDFIQEIEDGQIPINEFFDEDHTEWDPIKLFELFFDDELIAHIKTMSNQYAMESNASGFENITDEDLKCFIGILMVSGYYKVPQYRMMWEEKEDVQNLLVANAMRRARFEQVLRYIHFNSNTDAAATFAASGDKCSKVRPILDLFNQRCRKYALLTKESNVDESMIPYYGKYGNSLKQRMPQKPIRSGYKVWALNLRGGYCYSFEIYQGKGSQNQYTAKLGCGPSVALDLFDKLPKQGGARYKLYLDNYFTSLDLADELTRQGHGVTGTIKGNMLGNCPLTNPAEFKNMARGTNEVQSCNNGDTIVCRWLDNSIVSLVSNCDKVNPTEQCRRWSKKNKVFIYPQCPKLVKDYNASMGGTDAMDQSISAYRIKIRNRKWYWPLFTYTIHVALYNSWLLHRQLPNTTTQLSFLSFIREIAKTYLKTYGSARARPGVKGTMLYKKSNVAKRVTDGVRFDKVGHSLESQGSRSRCAFCCQPSSTQRCKKCNVSMHAKCFAAFHGL